jgi:hypothetical protein
MNISKGALSLGKGAVDWMAANPKTSLMLGNMAQSALAPDPVEEQIRLEEERRRMSNIAGIGGDDSGQYVGRSYGLASQASHDDLYAPTY